MKEDPSRLSLLMILGIGIFVGGITLLTERVTFHRPPENHFERLLTLPAIGVYVLTEDPWLASASTGIILMGILIPTGWLCWLFLQRRVFEPMRVREFIKAKQREKEWLNRFKDDTF